MRRAQLFLAPMLAIGLTVTAVPSTAAPIHRNCAAFNEKFPVGLAKSVNDALAATTRGKERPTVNKKAFAAAVKANPKLGSPKDGVICEVAVKITVPSEVQSLTAQAPTLTSPQTSMFLTWLPPTSDGRSPIVAYEISDGTQVIRSTLAGGSGLLTSYSIMGLTPGRSYTFTVKAINAAGGGAPAAVSATTAAAPTPTPTPTPAAAQPAAVRYENCAAARAAGVTPLRRGTAVYDANRHLDRDGDGVACE